MDSTYIIKIKTCKNRNTKIKNLSSVLVKILRNNLILVFSIKSFKEK